MLERCNYCFVFSQLSNIIFIIEKQLRKAHYLRYSWLWQFRLFIVFFACELLTDISRNLIHHHCEMMCRNHLVHSTLLTSLF